jgi:hypothetical protein
MPLSRAAVETELVNRLRGKLAYMSMSVLTNGLNPDLQGPIHRGLDWLSLFPADPVAVADSDFAMVTGWMIQKLYDAATLETLRHILGQTYEVDEQVGTNYQKLDQFRANVLSQIAELEKTLQKPYGPGMAAAVLMPMTSGVPMPNDTFNRGQATFTPGHWPYSQKDTS